MAEDERAAFGCPVKRQGLELQEICRTCEGQPPFGMRRVSRGQIIAVAGDPARHVFTVVSGFVKETCSFEDGRQQGLRLAGPGDLAGLEALVADEYASTLEAATLAEVCLVPKSALLRTLEERADQGAALSRKVCSELLELRQQMVRLGSMSAEERTLSLVTQLLSSEPPGAWARLPITRQELADLLGLGMSTVSRSLHRLADGGHLEIKGRMIRLPS